MMISYNTRLIASNEDLNALKDILKFHQIVFNFASKELFKLKRNSIVELHSQVYGYFRKSQSEIPAQVIIRGEQECLSSYRSIKSNRHKISKPIEKKNLSMRLDKRLYSIDKKDKYSIRITTSNKRKTFKFIVYDKLQKLLDKYEYCDPLIYLDNNNNLCISFTFDNKIDKIKPKLALGIDLGIRRSAAMSDGRIIIDRKFNAEKRRLRYLKRKLQSCGSKSAKKHLRKLRKKERNKNKNQTHLIVNKILETNADTFVLENLQSIKVKKHKYQNKNRISQVPLYEIRRILIYKAENVGKNVLLVCPSYTSQIDSLTNKKEGERRGCRFYAKNGLVYDADLNASRNIGQKSKLPVSYGNILDGQGSVIIPNVCKPINEN